MTIGQAWSVAQKRLYPFVCTACGKVQQQYAKRSVALVESDRIGGLPEVQTSTQRKTDKFAAGVAERQSRSCEVCGSKNEVQRHHWAPYHLFDMEADKWPTSFLCQPCHTRWHQIVTPNMGNPSPTPSAAGRG